MKLVLLFALVGFAAAFPYSDFDELHEVAGAEDELARLDFNIKDIFRKLKEQLLGGEIHIDMIKAQIEVLFGKGSDMTDALLEFIKKKGAHYKQGLLDLIDRVLGKEEAQQSISEYWEKIKNYFKDLNIDLKEKYAKFGEWVKNVAKDALDKSKGKLENIKSIAKEFLEHTKGVSKEVAEEALEFLRPYKEDLGGLYDQVKVAVKDILSRKE